MIRSSRSQGSASPIGSGTIRLETRLPIADASSSLRTLTGTNAAARVRRRPLPLGQESAQRRRGQREHHVVDLAAGQLRDARARRRTGAGPSRSDGGADLHGSAGWPRRRPSTFGELAERAQRGDRAGGTARERRSWAPSASNGMARRRRSSSTRSWASPGGGRGTHSGGGSGSWSGSGRTSAAMIARPATPSATQWCTFEISANRSPSTPSTNQCSHSGFPRSSSCDMIRPARRLSWRMSPGGGSAVWRTWNCRLKSASSTQTGWPNPLHPRQLLAEPGHVVELRLDERQDPLEVDAAVVEAQRLRRRRWRPCRRACGRGRPPWRGSSDPGPRVVRGRCRSR